MFQPNDKVGPYILIKLLGRGSFGEVWLGEKRTKFATTKFALKMPLEENVDLTAIEQEASVWVQSSGHPNVLPIIDADAYDGQIVIVSEYASDGSLEDWLQRHEGKAHSIAVAVKMIDGILAGLEHLHSRKIIHRDLKPANILLQGDSPRLADFGIARVLKSTQNSTVVAGTPLYMSPEAYKNIRTEQMDLWAAAVIFYQLLSGDMPFVGDNLHSLMFAILNVKEKPLPDTIPKPLRDFIATALNKNLNQRYTTAGEKRKAIQKAHQLAIKMEDEPVKIADELEGRRRRDGFVLIPAGEFLMGEDKHDDEKPVHKVKISRSFEMGKYEVTQTQWEAVMGNNPSNFKGENLPVEQVSWGDAQEFIKKLNARNDGYVYRLPTEAEWEYACRAGSTGDYAGELEKMAWYKNNSDSMTHPVGEMKPNDWGLYDMHGNVWEWCSDWYDSEYYGRSPGVDPKGPDSGSLRVKRGGSWFYDAAYCRSAYRSRSAPIGRFSSYGLRLVRTLQ
jgi:formylglycine-generating enzyme required for sulfatase activity/tRNA A-37 threonylcarbamoyl transferase component Bud32